MWKPSTNTFRNTCAWEQQDINETMKQKKAIIWKLKEAQLAPKKRSADALTVARANRSPEVDTPQTSL